MTSVWLDDELRNEADLQTPVVAGLWAGQVSRGAEEAEDLIYIRIPDVDVNVVFGPCRWPPIGVLLPARGDECLVGIDNQSNVWVIQWVPA